MSSLAPMSPMTSTASLPGTPSADVPSYRESRTPSPTQSGRNTPITSPTKKARTVGPTLVPPQGTDRLRRRSSSLLKLQMLQRRSSLHWVPDKERLCCVICGRTFHFFFRRHHCRGCGEVVCSDCSSKQKLLQDERYCDNCRTDLGMM